MALTREEIFKLADRPPTVEKVVIPTVGEFCLKVMTGTERDSYNQASIIYESGKVKPNFGNISAQLLVRTLCDDSGKLLFTVADVASVGKLPAKVVKVLADAAKKLNGLDDKEVDDAEKNSAPAGSQPSGTDSPAT